MKAIVIHEFGPADVLKYEDVPDPQPQAGEIRIRVHAATVNRVLDVSLRAGKEMFRGPTLPLIPGVDCAGIIDAVILWNTYDLGYLTVYVADGLANGRLKPGAVSLEAGRLGKVEIRGDQVILGTPFTFTKDNIDRFEF